MTPPPGIVILPPLFCNIDLASVKFPLFAIILKVQPLVVFKNF